jgi:hypothetical protein
VGNRCARRTDRICLDNSHCRDTEECVPPEGDEEFGTCIYQIPEQLGCPGSPGCADNDGTLRAAFAIRSITPTGFEEPRPEYVDDNALFTGDTEDPETYWDCGRDMICPGADDYTAPDADGSEGNENFDGVWLAGFDHSRPAMRCSAELLDDCEGPECCDNELAHDDIWARGVMFEQGDSKVALVSLDLVGFFYSDIQRIVAQLPEELELDLLIIAATHTHEAPDAIGQWGPGAAGSDLPEKTGVDSAHMQHIHSQVIALLAEADRNLVEVDVYAASVDTGTEGLAVKDSRDPWIFDDDLPVMQVVIAGEDRADYDNTLGLVVAWGSHPEAMSDENQYITSDFPHYAREWIENGFPEIEVGEETLPAIEGVGAPVVYFSASVGGLIGPLGRTGIARDGTAYSSTSWEKTDAIGQQIALAAFRALHEMVLFEGDLSFGSLELVTNVANLQFQIGFLGLDLFDREVYNWRHSDGLFEPGIPQLVTAVTRVQIGGLSFATMPGEIFPETLTGGFTFVDQVSTPVRGNPEDLRCDDDRLPTGGEDGTEPCLIDPDNPNPPDLDAAPNSGFIREELPGDVLFVIGLGMDEIGYLVPPYDFQLLEGAPYVGEPEGDHYEETNSVGPGPLSAVLDAMELLWDLDVDLFERE